MPKIRLATHNDIDVLNSLIQGSVRGLSQAEYSSEEIEGGLNEVFGVDTQLIQDETYYVMENDANVIVACGGWSKRKTLYGGNQFAGREDDLLTPGTDAAKIRAFFVHPDHARHGYGRELLTHCEQQAVMNGFLSFEMMATLPGVKLYEKCGYRKEDTQTQRPLSNGRMLGFFKMKKEDCRTEETALTSLKMSNHECHQAGL